MAIQLILSKHLLVLSLIYLEKIDCPLLVKNVTRVFLSLKSSKVRAIASEKKYIFF